jgi:hypothetical protein
MPIDEQRLTGLRRYEDARTGIFEEFVEPRLGPSDAIGLLAGPLGERRSPGWVVCPSVGPEHGNMRRLEALVARGLAGAGFPVLRIRPDLHPTRGLLREIDLSTRLQEVDDAVELMRARCEGGDVGLAGALFGATVAALACERHGLRDLVMIEPAVRGRQYARDAMMRTAVADLMSTAAAEGPAAHTPMRELEESGETTIRGLRLSKGEHDRIAAVDLVADLQTFRGRSLLVGVAPTGAASPGLRKLHERLAELGGHATLECLEDPLESPLGDYHYRNVGPLRVDTRLGLDQALAELTVTWALGAPAERSGAVPA